MNKNNKIKRITEIINDLGRKYSRSEIFTDWVKMMALSIVNSTCFYKDSTYEKREKEYLAIAKKYDEETFSCFSEMFALLVIAMEKEMKDILGEIYMNLGLGKKGSGQVFTPFHVAGLMANLMLTEDISPKKPYTMSEPTCGSGVMVIALAKIMKERGINYIQCLRVVAQDIDWTAVYMTFVQLSLYGIDAVVIQGDALDQKSAEYSPERVFATPARKGILKLFGGGI